MSFEQRTNTEPYNITTFIGEIYNLVVQHLGIIGHPLLKTKQQNLPTALRMIQLLEMLENKTNGNLKKEEENYLHTIIINARNKYDETIKSKLQDSSHQEYFLCRIIVTPYETVANDTLEKIRTGQMSFIDAAKEYSITLQEQQGYLGWKKTGDLGSVIDATVFKLKKNQVSEVIKLDLFGHAIIQLLDRKIEEI